LDAGALGRSGEIEALASRGVFFAGLARKLTPRAMASALAWLSRLKDDEA
jgi:hypothetical protein